MYPKRKTSSEIIDNFLVNFDFGGFLKKIKTIIVIQKISKILNPVKSA